jgi:hypothetical protein
LSIDKLPESILELGDRVKYLAVPIRFAKNLVKLPSNLETLVLTGAGSATLLPEQVFPQIKRVLTGNNELIFRSENLPNLMHLEFRLDRRRRMLAELIKFEKLRALTIEPSAPDVLDLVKDLPLRYLRPGTPRSRKSAR